MVVALTLANLTTPATADQWNDEELSIAETIGLPTTAFQPGQPERVIFAVMANIFQEEDVSSSIIHQAGFLAFAASGFVTYTDATGAVVTLFVTADPSIPAQNPTGALGWLDVLADGVYDVQRNLSAPAGGPLALLNTSGGAVTYGPFVAGTYHVAQPGAVGAPTYSNAASLTIPPHTPAGSVTGAVTSSGAVKLTVTAHGRTSGDVVYVTGIVGTTEANGAWVASVVDANHFVLVGSAFVHAWVSGGTVYLPTVATFTADVYGTGSDAVAGNRVTTPVTSLIGVAVANVGAWLGSDTEGNVALAARCKLKLQSLSSGGPRGAYLFFALSAQTYATKLTPPLTGRPATAITRALSTTDKTTGVVTTTVANAAGAPTGVAYPQPGNPPPDDGGDIYAIGTVGAAFAQPLNATAFWQAAANHSVTVAMTLYVPFQLIDAVKPVAQLAVQVYFKLLPIGGVNDPSGPQNVVPIEGVRGAVEVGCKAAGIPLQDMTLTLNSLTTNVQLLLTPVPEVALLANPDFLPTVVGF